MRILVTGGAGFIGSHFVNLMCDLGHEVIILDCLTYAGLQDNLDPRADFIYGNVCDVMLVNDLVHKVNMVVHFAAETHVARSIVNSRLFFETDVIGTQTVCEAVRRNPEVQLIHISTSEVYGTDWDVTRPMNEHHPLNPMSPYAAAKCGADRTVYSYIETYGIKAKIVRPFNCFGPRQHPEKLIPRFITQDISGEAMTVHGDGEAIRDYIYVDDLVEGINAVMTEHTRERVYNLGTGNAVSVNNVAECVSKIMESALFPANIGDRPGQVHKHWCDNTRALRDLNWKPETTWLGGLRETVDWYRQNVGQWATRRIEADPTT